jgi:nucleoside-diphosphate-sugar epimerase
MRCFVTGATGVIGRPLVPQLVAAGHEVVAVARGDEKAASLRAAGAEPAAVDLFDAGAVHAATAGFDAVLHLATNVPPVSKAARPSSWELHNRLRTEATANLVAAAEANGVRRFVKESITFVYPDGGDGWITEDTPPDPVAFAPTLEGERRALAFAASPASPERAAVVLRVALFYGGVGNPGTHHILTFPRWGLYTVFIL